MIGEVQIVPGVVGPLRITSDEVIYPGLGGPVSMWFDVRFDPELSKYVCYELTARRNFADQPNAGPVTTEVLRQIKVEHLIVTAMLNFEGAEPPIRGLDNPDGLEPWGLTAPDHLDGPNDRALRWVSHFYKLGFATSFGPAKTVEESLGLTRPTTGRWVRLAREAGYLGPAGGPGKAGI